VSRFPAAFRPPAFASRSSCSRRGIRRSSRSAYRPQGAGPRRGYRVPHARATTGVGALYTPRTTVLAPIWGTSPAGACRSTAARPSTPLQHPTLRGSASRGINEGSSNSPVRSSPRLWLPGWNGRPWAFLRASHPAVTGGARRGWGQAIEHGPGTTRSTSHQSTLRPVVHSLRATSRRTVRSGRVRLGRDHAPIHAESEGLGWRP
jgi:hypothetical protein